MIKHKLLILITAVTALGFPAGATFIKLEDNDPDGIKPGMTWLTRMSRTSMPLLARIILMVILFISIPPVLWTW
jgi:hypothetical protein